MSLAAGRWRCNPAPNNVSPTLPTCWLTKQWLTLDAAFGTVTISIADGPDGTGFSFNETGLQWNYKPFNGWIACDWWHGVPQLFAQTGDLRGNLPSSCSRVDLYAVAY